MASSATQVANVISKTKDYDVSVKIPLSGNFVALEYAGITLPGRGEASTYNLITNLRNIQESAGDGEYNALVIQVPMSLATYKDWHDKYDEACQVKFASTLSASLSLTFNCRVAGIGDWDGAFDAINPIDITFNMNSFVEEE